MGPDSPLWKGGQKKERGQQMSRAAYRDWRTAVYARDDWTCRQCGARSNGVYLNAHHIKQWSLHPELRYDVSNGITLCRPCHQAIPHRH
jgi:5-methylcytosine-specific restriction endonuclease McrA